MNTLIKLTVAAIAVIGLTTVVTANEKYSPNHSQVIPCDKIPQKVWEADKFFANLKIDQIVDCPHYIYKARLGHWLRVSNK